MSRLNTLHEILPADAREDRQITFLEGENQQRVLSFRRLRQRAVGLLGALQRLGLARGDRVILFLADNERFVEMFWACVLGGIVPVPLAPGGTAEHLRKLWAVFEQQGRGRVCIDAQALERFDGFAATEARSVDAQALRARAVVPAALDMAGEPGQVLRAEPEQLAFIQYSSGSTGEPKGVLLTHRNLCANIASIIEAAAFSDRDVALSWMPLSHDMGLIGFHLNMLACGVSHAIMRTELFARRPLLWLEQASRMRATVLCSPNFGYQHYLKQYELKPRQLLDLASVRLIFNGAEPISAELCRRFTQAMAPHGLKANSMFAVYGLAEASLAVSFPRPGAALQTLHLDRAGLRVSERVRTTASPDRPLTELVKLGGPVPGTEIRIVDGAGVACGDQVLGHVQIRGDNVAAGYFAGPAATVSSPAAGAWLDTGDLGLFSEGQLVITGRAKDLVIVNGQNFYPHDFERIVQQVADIDANRVAAAGVRSGSGEGEVLVLFVLHRGDLASFVPKALGIRRAIGEQTGLEVAQVVPVAQIPKTTSGKLQRYLLARAFEQGEFETVLGQLAPLLAPGLEPSADEAGAGSTVRRLLDICQRVVTDRQITPATNLLESNLNSLSLARIHEAIEHEFPHRIEVTDLFDCPTLEELARFMDARKG
jgi:acyl-CoA synthetase (AMP-forming)/AMP-acid ligase II/acyl carrier protein